MRGFCLVVVLAVLGFGLSNLKASEGFEELSAKAKAGATEEELNAFVQKSNVAYDLTVDEIFVLNDLGYSSKTIAAIIDHGKDIKAGKAPATEVALVPAAPEVVPNRAFEQPPVAAVNVEGQNNLPPAQAGAQVPTIPNQPTLTTSTGETLHIEEAVNANADPSSVVAPPEGDASVGMFYESLSPYGTWVKLDGGWYWQPTACLTDPTWRPYCDRGHWAWTDNDWCWQSDYSWGWAPFHYGRWSHCDGYGWVWMPDTVWSPAWVSWRECDSHYGWAPLPWHARFEIGVGFGRHHGGFDVGFGLGFRDYCFCPCDHFCDVSLRLNILRGHENERIFGRTTIIENRVTVINNRVIVGGPHFDRVQEHVGVQIKQLHLADANIKAGDHLTRANREDRRNGTIQMYRPTIKQTSTVTPTSFASKHVPSAMSNRIDPNTHLSTGPVRTPEHITQPTIQHEKFGENNVTAHPTNTVKTPNVVERSELKREPVTETKTVTQSKTYETTKTYEVPSHQSSSPAPTGRGGSSSSNYNNGNGGNGNYGNGNSGNNNYGNGSGKDRNNR